MPVSRTIIISCAGEGKRLGFGCTKALLDICGRPLILHQLDMLKKEEDIRIVVGYQAEKVIDIVNRYRKDITFVFNYEYKHNGTGASVSLAMKHSNKHIFTLDGDLLVHPEDMYKMLECEDEFIAGTEPSSDDPWLLDTSMYTTTGEGENKTEMVEAFSRHKGIYEWTGISQIERKKLSPGIGHVFQMLEPALPVKLMKVKTKEIDTANDYEKAVRWFKNNYSS